MCLEFSKVKPQELESLYDLYSFQGKNVIACIERASRIIFKEKTVTLLVFLFLLNNIVMHDIRFSIFKS